MGVEEKIDKIEEIFLYLPRWVRTRTKSLEFANATWLKNLEKTMALFETLFWGSRRVNERRFSRETYITDCFQAFPAAVPGTGGHDDHDDGFDLKGAVALDDTNRAGAKFRLCAFHDSCQVKKQKVSVTTTKLFELATKSINSVVLVDKDTSTILASSKRSHSYSTE